MEYFWDEKSELSNHELLDVLSEVVLKLSGHDTWNCGTPYNVPFKQCSKWYFIKGVRLLSKYCKEHSAAYCLWMKTCKRYFKSALSIQDEYSESIQDACHVYMSALYYASGTNQEKMTKHILEAKNGPSFRNSLKPHTLSYSTLLFVDTVAHVCGFCFLFGQVLLNQDALSENGFTLTALVYCLIIPVLRKSNSNSSIKIDRTELTELNFTSLFDICLWAVSVHKYSRMIHGGYRKIPRWSSNIPEQLSNNGEGMRFFLEESLEETLVKISVDMFKKYYDLHFITLKQNGKLFRCEIVSHFKALNFYRKGEYMKLLNTCNSIISQGTFFSPEKRKHLKFLLDQDVPRVSVPHAFQTLFGNDGTCLTGLILLINPSCFKINNFIHQDLLIADIKCPRNSFTQTKFIQGYFPIFSVARVSCLFLVYYLRLQSLIHLHFPKSVHTICVE